MTTSKPSSPGSGGGEEDDDDRKPPAKEIVVKSPNQNPSRSSNNNGRNNGAANETFSSTEASVASTASSVSAGWTASPVARANPRNNSSTSATRRRYGNDLQTPSNNLTKTKGASQDDLPSLTASTPCSPSYRENADVDSVKNSNGEQASFRALRLQLVVWLATVLVAVAVLIYQIVPAAVMATLLFIVASTGMMTQTLVLAARRWYFETVTAGRGIGPWLLPRSLYETLTETSLHEYMTAPSPLGVENLHLLLYFLPLSAQQLDEAIQRLGPHHRERLFRRGLGHIVLGDGVMRMILGEPRFRELQQLRERELQLQQRNQPSSVGIDVSAVSGDQTIEVLNSPRQRRLLSDESDEHEDDDDRDSDLDVSTHDVPRVVNQASPAMSDRRLLSAAATPTTLTARMPTASSLPSAVNTPSSSAESSASTENDQEMQVVVDALWNSAYGTIINPMRDYMTSTFVQPTVLTASRWGTRLGVFFSLSTFGGLGAWWWTNSNSTFANASWGWPMLTTIFSGAILSDSSARTTSLRDRPNASQAHDNLWSSVALGGVTMGLTLLAQHRFRRQTLANQPAAPNPSPSLKERRATKPKKTDK